MRGKRSKQYRKLMQQFGLSFGFREPYQVIVDAAILEDADRFKMDLVGGLERTLHGTVKPMITQCSMRHLYNSPTKSPRLIEQAKGYERRRCGHHTLDEPLSTFECLSSVVDGKNNNTNKHRYVIASQDVETRAHMRSIPGVPLIYIARSVMILEPMAEHSEKSRERDEREKLRTGLKGKERGVKRKRGEDGEGQREGEQRVIGNGSEPETTNGTTPSSTTTKKRKGPKGPNPLSIKKPKKRSEPAVLKRRADDANSAREEQGNIMKIDRTAVEETEVYEKKRRKRRHKRSEVSSTAPGEGDAGMTLE